jgi:putative hydrolase of the HAD superfamily
MPSSDLHERFKQVSRPLKPIDTGTSPRLTTLSDIRVIAYDFYGTLFLSGVGDIGVDDGKYDSEALLEALQSADISVTNSAAGNRGFQIYNNVVEKMIDDLKDKGIEYPEPDIRQVWFRVLQQLREQELISGPVSDKVAERISVEFEARMNPVWPVPDAVQTLLYFKEKGFAQGIISNSQFYTPVVLEALSGYSLEHLGLHHELLHWSYEENMKKPGLTFYRNFIRKLHSFDSTISPSDVLYVGNDMLKDIYPAHKLGMKTALFAGDQRSLKWRKEDDRCKNLQPDLIITKFDQLQECVIS